MNFFLSAFLLETRMQVASSLSAARACTLFDNCIQQKTSAPIAENPIVSFMISNSTNQFHASMSEKCRIDQFQSINFYRVYPSTHSLCFTRVHTDSGIITIETWTIT